MYLSIINPVLSFRTVLRTLSLKSSVNRPQNAVLFLDKCYVHDCGLCSAKMAAYDLAPEGARIMSMLRPSL